MKPIVLSLQVREDRIVEDSGDIIKAIKPHWQDHSSEIRHKIFTDGITNKLVGFYLTNDKDDMIIIKVYGHNTEMMIDRNLEINTMERLYKENCGPAFYGRFKNGICYQFIPGTTLDDETCRSEDVYPLIAKEMARLHSSVPLQSNELKSFLWNKMTIFSQLVYEIMEEDERIRKGLHSFGMDKDSLVDKLDELKRMIGGEDMPLGFCHNDLLLANIVLNEEKNKISFIDYEYAMPNYVPFDIANHFNEFAGVVNPDYSRCPDRKFRVKWISVYLSNFKPLYSGDTNMENFVKFVDLCIPASHFFWSLWSVVQAKNSAIDFDFVEYAGVRFTEYKKTLSFSKEG